MYEDTDLFNLVLAATSSPKRGFANPIFRNKHKTVRKILDSAIRLLRTDLVGAQRFKLQPSLMHHAASASLMQPKRLLDMFRVGVPCFDNLWIEWNDTKRLPILSKCMDDLGIEFARQEKSHVTKIGFHITTNAPHQGWLVQQYSLIEGKIHSPQWAISFSDKPLNARKMAELCIQFKDTPGADNLSDQIDDIEAEKLRRGPSLLGAPYCNYWGDQHRKPLTDIFDRICMTLGTFTSEPLKIYSMLSNGGDAETYRQSKDQAELMWTGHIRYLVATLALLNYPHTIIERKTEGTKLCAMAFGQRVPRNEVRLLDIDLPKPRGTTQYEQMFTGAMAPKRRHARRGHWRKFKHADSRITTRWIKEQWVGNADLGTIIHDYNLKSRGGV